MTVPHAPVKGAHSLADHPKGLSTLFFAELWERFSYYGMRALLVLFMVSPVGMGGLGFDTAHAGLIYGNYTMAVYMLSIPGGIIADRIMGPRRAVLVGGFIIMCGHFTLAFHTLPSFYGGLLLIVLGTGLFKPNVSVLVGRLYQADDTRRDAGFSLFYMGINIGAFFAPLVTGFLAQSETFKSFLDTQGIDPTLSWHFGFAAAGFGMMFGLLILYIYCDRFPNSSQMPKVAKKDIRDIIHVIIGTGLLLGAVLISDIKAFHWLRALYLLIPVAAIFWFAREDDLDLRRLAALFVFFIAAMIFWAVFEQAGVSIALFADKLTSNNLLGWSFPSSWYQSLNPLFVILLAPLFAIMWTRMGDRQPSSPIKFTLGLLFLALSFLLMVPAAQLTIQGKVSPLWLVGLFLLQTIGELFLSPVGLSTMTKLAPVRMVGLVMGVWFLSASFGSKLAGLLGGTFKAHNADALMNFFLFQAGLVALTMLAMYLISPWVKRLMGAIR